MTILWQTNTSWINGLIKEIPVSRWQIITASKITEVLIFEKRHPNSPPHPTNLSLHTILKDDISHIRAPLITPDRFMYIEVDMRSQSIDMSCALYKINSSVNMTIGYRVINAADMVIDNDDPLASLLEECERSINRIVNNHMDGGVSKESIENQLSMIDVSTLGLVIEKVVIKNDITWPTAPTKFIVFDCKFVTRDYVSGSVNIHIDYKISKKDVDEQVISRRISLEGQKALQDALQMMDYTQINTRSIDKVLRSLNFSKLGVTVESIFLPKHIIWPTTVPVDQSRQVISVDCKFTTHDFIEGSVKVYLDYIVSDPQKLMRKNENISVWLSVECRRAVTFFTSDRVYSSISIRDLEKELMMLDITYMGITIAKVAIPDSITWPTDVVTPGRDIVLKTQYAQLLQDKLKTMGVSHPAAVLRVLSQYDTDIKAIFDAIQYQDSFKKDQQNKSLNLLLKLMGEDKVTRDQLEGLINNLIDSVNRDIDQNPDQITSFFVAPQDTKQIPPTGSTRIIAASDSSPQAQTPSIYEPETIQHNPDVQEIVSRDSPETTNIDLEKSIREHTVQRKGSSTPNVTQDTITNHAIIRRNNGSSESQDGTHTVSRRAKDS